jgi:hypothetical protein
MALGRRIRAADVGQVRVRRERSNLAKGTSNAARRIDNRFSSPPPTSAAKGLGQFCFLCTAYAFGSRASITCLKESRPKVGRVYQPTTVHSDGDGGAAENTGEDDFTRRVRVHDLDVEEICWVIPLCADPRPVAVVVVGPVGVQCVRDHVDQLPPQRSGGVQPRRVTRILDSSSRVTAQDRPLGGSPLSGAPRRVARVPAVTIQ